MNQGLKYYIYFFSLFSAQRCQIPRINLMKSFRRPCRWIYSYEASTNMNKVAS